MSQTEFFNHKNCNFASNSKMGHFLKKIGLWFIGYHGETFEDKKMRVMRLERRQLSKKNETNSKSLR